MKVLQAISTLETGGAENLVVNLALGLAEENINSDLLVLKDGNSKNREILKSSDKYKGDINFLTSRSIYNPFIIFSIIPYLRKYDIIHIHLFPTIYWVVIAKWISFSSVKLIYTEHSTYNSRRNKLIFRFFDSLFYSGLSKIICISEGTKKNLQKHLISKPKLEIILNGVKLEKFNKKFINNFLYYPNKFIVIQVANLREAKDQLTVIKSLKLLPVEICLLLVGQGEMENTLKKYVESNDLSSRVKFLGLRSDIPELLSTSDIVVLSSHYEGFGLAAVEGMAANKPVIASNVEGLKEVVGGFGILFEVSNYVELSRNILELYNNKEYYEKIRSRCFDRSKAFSLDKMVNEYKKCYEEI